MAIRLVIVLMTSITLQSYSQVVIKGEVRFKGDSLPLPGINVIEKGTNNGITTDADGRFTINCLSNSPVLIFSFIGLRTIERNAEGDMIVYLEEDPEQLGEKLRFGMYPEYTGFGFSSGVNYTPVGIRIENALPVLFGRKMKTTTTITYRTGFQGNKFIDIRLRRHELIQTSYYGRHINLCLGYNNREAVIDNNSWRVQEFNVISEFVYDGFIVRGGYGQQPLNDVENVNPNHAVIFGFGKYFPQISLIATAKKWNGYWQTEFEFIKWFKSTDFEFGIKFETLDRYRELNLFVSYNIHY
jgi:hypothetical protein